MNYEVQGVVIFAVVSGKHAGKISKLAEILKKVLSNNGAKINDNRWNFDSIGMTLHARQLNDLLFYFVVFIINSMLHPLTSHTVRKDAWAVVQTFIECFVAIPYPTRSNAFYLKIYF